MTDTVAQTPVSGAAAITPSDVATITGDTAPGIGIAINCTVAGNVKLRLADGTTITIAVIVGTLLLNWRVTQVFVTGTTAVSTIFTLRG